MALLLMELTAEEIPRMGAIFNGWKEIANYLGMGVRTVKSRSTIAAIPTATWVTVSMFV